MKKILLPALFFILIALQSCVKNEVIIPNLRPSDFTIETEAFLEEISLAWSESTDPEKTKITYEIKVNSILVATDSVASTYLFENLIPDTEYLISVTAVDGDGIRTLASEKVRTDVAPTPAAFDAGQSGKTPHSITISWDESTISDNSEVVYDLYLDDVLVASDNTDLEFTFEDLEALDTYTVKIVARSIFGNIRSNTLEAHTDGNYLVFGESNFPEGQPISEANFGIIEMPVLVRDFANLNPSVALEEMQFEFAIVGNVNGNDYELLTPSPLVIAKGESSGTIRLRIIADDFQEFPNEFLIVEPGLVKNGRFSGRTEQDGQYLGPHFVLRGLDYDWLQEAPDVYSAAVSWSDENANIAANLYRETATTSAFTKAESYETDSHPLRFEMPTSIEDGSYYLELVRNDDIQGPIEASVYMTVPASPQHSTPNLAAVKTLWLENGAGEVIFDIEVRNGIFTFTSRD